MENAVQANIKAMFTENNAALGEIFNIAVSERISINELFEILIDLTGSNISPIYQDERPGDIKNSLADISKAKRLLNYAPEIKHNEGLKITLEWFKSITNYELRITNK